MSLFFHFFLILHFTLSFFVRTSEICQDSILTVPVSPPPYRMYVNQTENFSIIELNNSTGAKCSDGTNYKFFYNPGSGENKKKFMFLFQGGGYCGFDNADLLLSCSIRTSSFLGSSRFTGLNGSLYTTNFSYGYFSSDPTMNPLFSDWQKIYILYCDGTLFQGYKEEPLNYNGTDIWFRGYNNTKSVFEYARKHWGLFEATEVIMAGVSSGGNALFYWLPYLRNYLPKEIIMRGISDGGLFIDILNLNSKCYLFRAHIMDIVNITESEKLDLFENCSFSKNKSEFWKCLMPEYLIDDLHIPMFIMNSQNDFEGLRTAYGLHCLSYGIKNCSSDVNEKIALYRELFLSLTFKIKEKKPNWGFWLRRCLEHYYTNSRAWGGNLTAYSAENYQLKNVMEGLNQWYLNQSVSYIDLEDWSNDCPTF